MNERIKALRHVIDMAQDFSDNSVLGATLEAAIATGIPHADQIAWAQAKQQGFINAVLELVDEAEDADAIPAEKAKLALAVAEPFHIEGMMVISTGHVAEETMKWLTPMNHFPLIVQQWSEQGTVVYVPPDQEAWNAVAKDNSNSDVPDELFACMCHARAHGCCWLLLDADGPKVEGLATFDW